MKGQITLILFRLVQIMFFFSFQNTKSSKNILLFNIIDLEVSLIKLFDF